MTSFLDRLLGQSAAAVNRQLAELQLRLMVSLAMADGMLHDEELEHVADFIDRAAPDEREHERLTELVDEIVDMPQDFGELIEALGEWADRGALGERIVDELTHVADADFRYDFREAFLIDLVRDVFELVDDEPEDIQALRQFVHPMAEYRRAA